MSERLLKEWIKEILLEETEPQRVFRGRAYRIALPDDKDRLLTIFAEVSGAPLNGKDGLVLDFGQALRKTHKGADVRRENRKFINGVERIMADPMQRKNVGDLFENVITAFVPGSANANLPGEADYPFADVLWKGTYWSVKGTYKRGTKGFASSPVHINVLVTMLLENEAPGDAPLKKIGIMSGNTNEVGDNIDATIVAYGPQPVGLEVIDSWDDSQRPRLVSLTIGDLEPIEFEDQKRSGKASWKIVPGTKPSWITGAGSFSTEDAAVAEALGPPRALVKFHYPKDIVDASSTTTPLDTTLYPDQDTGKLMYIGRDGEKIPVEAGLEAATSHPQIDQDELNQLARKDYILDDITKFCGPGKSIDDCEEAQQSPYREILSMAQSVIDQMDEHITRNIMLRLIKESGTTLLKEELTKSDKKEIEKISRKQAKKEIQKIVGNNFEKTIREAVKKSLKDKATKQEIGDISKAVIKKLYRELSFNYPMLIDRIKV